MPNWCQNYLTVIALPDAPSDAVTAFFDDIRLTVGTSRPTPGPGLFTTLLGPIEGGYERRVETWGTKWDVTPDDLTYHPQVWTPAYVELEFGSAWTPPEAGVIALSAKYPHLVFRLSYDEPGANYSGWMLCARGEVLDEVEFSISLEAHETAIRLTDGSIEQVRDYAVELSHMKEEA